MKWRVQHTVNMDRLFDITIDFLNQATCTVFLVYLQAVRSVVSELSMYSQRSCASLPPEPVI